MSSKRLYRTALAILLFVALLILGVRLLMDSPSLRTSDNLSLYLTVALASFACIEATSAILQERRDKRRKRTIDLRNELEKLYGPVYSVLNNVVYGKVTLVILDENQKTTLDEAFSKEPSTLNYQEQWWHYRNSPDALPKFIESFNNEYERRKEEAAIEKQFSSVYSIFREATRRVEEGAILYPEEKVFIDKKFSAYPYMLTPELLESWKKDIRSQELKNYFSLHLELMEKPRPRFVNSEQSTQGMYLIPKAFITKFLSEYDKKEHDYKKE